MLSKDVLKQALMEYVNECRDDWIVEGDTLCFQPPPMGSKASDIPSMKLISQSLSYATEMERIVYMGTKLNIDYSLEEVLDEDQQEEIHDYFMESETDKIDVAIEEFDGDYDDEELRLYRIKFISEVPN